VYLNRRQEGLQLRLELLTDKMNKITYYLMCNVLVNTALHTFVRMLKSPYDIQYAYLSGSLVTAMQRADKYTYHRGHLSPWVKPPGPEVEVTNA